MPPFDRSEVKRLAGVSEKLLRIVLSIIVTWLVYGGADNQLQLFGWMPPTPTAAYGLRAFLFVSMVFVSALRQIFWAFVLCPYALPVAATAVPVAVFNFVLDSSCAMFLSRQSGPIGAVDLVAIFSFVIGSLLESGSEIQRHAWKQISSNRGKVYTRGLFAYAVNINYFGYTVWRLGLLLLSRAYPMLLIIAYVVYDFLYTAGPALAAHNRVKYGPAYDAYAARTHRFVPFVF